MAKNDGFELGLDEIDYDNLILIEDEPTVEITLMNCGCGVTYAVPEEIEDERLLEVCPDCAD